MIFNGMSKHVLAKINKEIICNGIFLYAGKFDFETRVGKN